MEPSNRGLAVKAPALIAALIAALAAAACASAPAEPPRDLHRACLAAFSHNPRGPGATVKRKRDMPAHCRERWLPWLLEREEAMRRLEPLERRDPAERELDLRQMLEGEHGFTPDEASALMAAHPARALEAADGATLRMMLGEGPGRAP